jgi:hypothetical protein
MRRWADETAWRAYQRFLPADRVLQEAIERFVAKAALTPR